MTKLTLFGFAAAGLLLLSGCGSKGHSATGSTTVANAASTTATAVTSPSSLPTQSTAVSRTVPPGDVCALVTQQEASVAFGAQSSAPQAAASPLASGKACAYFANANQDSLQVGLLLNASQSQLAAIKSSIQLPGAATSTPRGIGDSATVISAGPTAVVIFNKGSNVVVVTLNRLGQSTSVGAATVLAKAAAARV